MAFIFPYTHYLGTVYNAPTRFGQTPTLQLLSDGFNVQNPPTNAKTLSYFARYSDVAAVWAADNLGLDQNDFARYHFLSYGTFEGRTFEEPTAAPPSAPAGVNTVVVSPGPPPGQSNPTSQFAGIQTGNDPGVVVSPQPPLTQPPVTQPVIPPESNPAPPPATQADGTPIGGSTSAIVYYSPAIAAPPPPATELIATYIQTPADIQVLRDESALFASRQQRFITEQQSPAATETVAIQRTVSAEQITAVSNVSSDRLVIDAEDDPREQSRLDAETRLDDTPAVAPNSTVGLTGAVAAARILSESAADPAPDWRVRLKLAPGANYLYKAADAEGILLPLKATDGIIFPYTPAIQVAYAAHYEAAKLTHSNYNIHQYGSSSVDSISITCDFTAQDTFEANYLLAVIHFFRSVTKMFYGQDSSPNAGTPPPLCYLTGLGEFQFDSHPLAVTAFTYVLPTDVDYIRAGGASSNAGAQRATSSPTSTDPVSTRQYGSGLQRGAANPPPRFNFTSSTNTQSTYVPTKMQIAITAIPIVSRKDISNNFSLKDYASGKLLQKGIW